MKSTFNTKIKTLISSSDFRNISLILTIFFIASLILYGYFFMFTQYRMQLIYQNWDGPSYVVIAKSLYNKNIIPKVNTLRLPAEYFAAHPPLYPLLIRLFSFIGYFQSMILVSLSCSALYLIAFYYFIKKYTSNKNAFLLSLLSIFVTPRWFAISHIGSSEPLFLFLLTLMIILIRNKKTLIAALVAMLLQLTRFQGILIFGGVMLYYLHQRISKEISTKQFIKTVTPFFIMPLSLVFVFLIYQIQLGDFFAFFKAQEIANVSPHLQFPPFKILLHNYYLPSAIESWREIYIFYYVSISYMVIKLFQMKEKLLGYIGLVYAIPLFFLVHADIPRYSIPLLPLFFIAFHKQLSKKSLLLAIAITIPAIFTYAVNLILYNLSP